MVKKFSMSEKDAKNLWESALSSAAPRVSSDVLPKESVEMASRDVWVVLLSTIRYSLGRSTYMTSLAWELVLLYHEGLSNEQLEQIIREIQKEVDMYRRVDKALADESTWLRGCEKLQSLLDSRTAAASDPT